MSFNLYYTTFYLFGTKKLEASLFSYTLVPLLNSHQFLRFRNVKTESRVTRMELS